MASLMQLFNEWEIQMLVLLSFMLQAFLFFGGGLRRHTSNGFLRILIWISYLGADLVAAYALGLISRHDGDATSAERDTLMGTHQLVFMWAPFLLIHLGGQDTITGFSLEDNNLWRRHLLNLVVQMALALYIFWKSANGPNKQFLAPCILLFVTGTIKYGERTLALKYGDLRNLTGSLLPSYARQLKATVMASRPFGREEYNQLLEQINSDDSSSRGIVLSIALSSLDSAISFLWHDGSYRPILNFWVQERGDLLPKVLEIELGLVYDYIYTKAGVFQTMSGIILRGVSQASFVASFLLFLVSNKQRNNSADIAITYALFAGGFSLEVCGVCTAVMSPWGWAWLESRHCSFLTSVIMWWQRKQVLWSHSMGQYNLRDVLGQYYQQHSTSWMQGLMAGTRKVVEAVCGSQLKYWISKQLDTKFVEVDKEIMWCIFQKVIEYETSLPQQWPNLGALLQQVLMSSDSALNWNAIARLHIYTEAQLRVYSPSPGDVDGESTGVLVQKLSNYMVYLLAMQPGMLPLSKDANMIFSGVAAYFDMAMEMVDNNTNRDEAFHRLATEELTTKVGVPVPAYCTREQLLETKEAWIRLLVYIAGRSRPEMHAAQLARGGELLSFVWLFMAFKGLGDSALSQIEIVDEHVRDDRMVLFCFPPHHQEQIDRW
ncbi:unnamed protein product [Urochloa humidicola]